MYTLRRSEFGGADERRIRTFVECWERYYQDRRVTYRESDLPINYMQELNVAGLLSDDNLVHLLRWKDPRLLTHPLVSENRRGTENPRVKRVLAERTAINDFRQQRMSTEDFAEVMARVFPSDGIVYRLFLFHIARPLDWPIADQNVFRAFAAMYDMGVPETIEEFQEEYIKRFDRLASRLRSKLRVDQADRLAVLTVNKRLDSALMMFGKFLSRYDC
jgi:hypothetical protein